ncbi:uncharacterized protein M6B38_299805 [Iris pallida]|uniref:DUF4378 domain-containing protein n=1 Tax=Iris pallida TaxID=29817 RepID=A0AAX6HQF2_IRIPA|nr:uncharacterized protein M6B38_299805 [Iris pallida]
MINIFDLSSGMPTTKLLTDKPHRDGSPPSRNRSDIVKKKPVDIVVVEDNSISNDQRKSSSKKSSGTPMKMLIAQELSRDVESKHKQTNIVARLMGLDALPGPKSDPTPKRSLQEGYSHNQCNPPSSNHKKEYKDGYKDVYEVWQQPPRADWFNDQPPRKGRIDNENITEKRMALVRQKFSEAKRLSMDERLLQTKEFQDALEVLSSNRDLFVKFLGEPNSLFSKNFCGIQSLLPSQTKRITVLKPSKTMEVKSEVQIVKPLYPSLKNIDHDTNKNQRNSRSSSFIHYRDESISNPTRIVVLKPSPGIPNEMNKTVASLINPPKQAEGRDFNGSSAGTEEDAVSREVVKAITQQMQQHLSSHRRDEPLLTPSALPNGYVGDESSFNRSEDDFTEEGCFNVSDSDAVTPTSRHSCDYNNRFGSPHSNSSFARACSPEPSVIKEAKKRLSERWAMVASNGMIYQEQNQMRRSSSTLGEMLSIPKAENEEGSDRLNVSSRRSCSGEQEPKTSIAGCSDNAPSNLPRSKSLPVSSSAYGNLNIPSKTNVPKEGSKPKSGASSFREKLSSFFSRSKKSARDNHIPSLSDDRLHRNRAESSSLESFHDGNSEASMHMNSEKYGGALSIRNSLNDGEKKHVTPSAKASRSSEKARFSEISRENQDLPSPVLVLEGPFEDDTNNITQRSIAAVSGHPQALSRSPPIGSISRTLTWDDSPQLGRPLSCSSKLSKVLSKECEEQERFAFVHKLLSSASLVDRIDCSTILARWYSLDSPLDPVLLDEFLDRKGEEAKCRERRSNQRLLYDCVNAALLDIGRSALKQSYPYAWACGRAWWDSQKCSLVAEEVWRSVRDLFSSEEERVAFKCGNRNVVVEGLVDREVAGRGWTESMRSEIDEFGEEIGREVLEELVKETLADLAYVCSS